MFLYIYIYTQTYTSIKHKELFLYAGQNHPLHLDTSPHRKTYESCFGLQRLPEIKQAAK